LRLPPGSSIRGSGTRFRSDTRMRVLGQFRRSPLVRVSVAIGVERHFQRTGRHLGGALCANSMESNSFAWVHIQ